MSVDRDYDRVWHWEAAKMDDVIAVLTALFVKAPVYVVKQPYSMRLEWRRIDGLTDAIVTWSAGQDIRLYTMLPAAAEVLDAWMKK